MNLIYQEANVEAHSNNFLEQFTTMSNKKCQCFYCIIYNKRFDIHIYCFLKFYSYDDL